MVLAATAHGMAPCPPGHGDKPAVMVVAGWLTAGLFLLLGIVPTWVAIRESRRRRWPWRLLAAVLGVLGTLVIWLFGVWACFVAFVLPC